MLLKGLSAMIRKKFPQYEDIEEEEEEDIEKLLQKDAPLRKIKNELIAIKVDTTVNHL